MEPESSTPYPQVTAIRPYPEPTPSSPKAYISQIHTPHAVAIGSRMKWGNLYLVSNLIYFVFIHLYGCELNSTALYDPVSNFINAIKKHTFS